MVRNDDLPMRLKALGFPLFENEGTADANLTLAEMSKSGDMRLWEGFPVVLANCASRGLLDYAAAMSYLKRPAEKSCLASLVAMALALYRTVGTVFLWADGLRNNLNADKQKECDAFFKSFETGGDVKLCGRTLSAQRVKSVFSNYHAQAGQGLGDLLQTKDEFGLEYALSQVFSPKQKDLFLKKLRGEKLTKTEKEYFSRAVKKKALALANPDLHRLARKLLG